MAQKSSIQWTEQTWNPVTGCSKVSLGCKNCYAETIANRFWGDRKFTDVQCHEDRLDQPLKRKKPTMYFVNSMSDLFHEDVPDEFIDKVFAVMAFCSKHTFQVLTKRPERMAKYLETMGQCWEVGWEAYPDRWDKAKPVNQPYITTWPLPNVWLGTSVENQDQLTKRLPDLVACPAAIRFLSCEPLLGPVDFVNIEMPYGDFWNTHLFDTTKSISDYLHWIIVGGESGPGARPNDLAWARSLLSQCKAAGVAAFNKQLGSCPQSEKQFRPYSGAAITATDYLKLRDPKGGNMHEWPEDLRVREMPEGG